MFGLGMGELIIILVIALLVFGPQKLPDLASSLGKAIRSFRRATQDLTNQLDVEDEVKQPFRELKAALRNEPEPFKPAPPPASVPKAEPQAEPKAELPAEKPADKPKA
jgi:TatA/E family protein of Tat protein translocase